MTTLPRVAVLGFHKIGPAPGGWVAAQLTWLRDHGWPAIDLATFLQGLADPGVLSERSALITFDDACRSLRREALACLRRFNVPAVVFAPTAFLGGRNDFDGRTQPDEAICDWNDLRELQRGGISVQSHAVSHRAFSTLTDAELADEITQSKTLIEAELGTPVGALAYPYGDDGPSPERVREILRTAGYRAAFLYALDAHPIQLPISDVYRLDRIAIGPDTDLAARLD